MRVTKYILAMVVGSLALLTGARLDVTVVQADPPAKPAERTKRAAASKGKSKRLIPVDLNMVAAPAAVINTVVPPPPPGPQSTPVNKKPHVDMEGLVLGDVHVQPNLILSTDTRYDNSTTRELGQRADLDFLAARRHGDRVNAPNPVDDLIRASTKPPATPGSPGSNDPGYEVAVAVREQINVMPPTPATAPAAPPPAAAAPVPASAPARDTTTRKAPAAPPVNK